MANPHSAYPHPGPTYYQPSPPPPNHVYGTHSPGPGHSPNPYQYIYPPPHHMNSHHHHHHHPHAPTSGRINGRGGSYQNRGGGHGSHAHPPPHMYHQNYHPSQHQTYPHPLLHAPHPQHPHPQHPAKFPHPYTPPYPYPSPTSAAPYSPSWQPQQPQSPLPKQLNMPSPRGFSPAYYEPPSAPAPPQILPPPAIAPEPPATTTTTPPSAAIPIKSPLKGPATEAPVITNEEEISDQSNPDLTETQDPDVSEIAAVTPSAGPEPAVEEESLLTSPTPASLVSHPLPPTPAETSALIITTTTTTAPTTTTTTTTTTYTMGSISNHLTSDLNIPPSPTHSISSTKSHSRSHKPSSSSLSLSFSINPVASIAIWSRRPGDPSKAPGIIISPRARPPSEIVQQALTVSTPPASPKPVIPSISSSSSRPPLPKEHRTDNEQKGELSAVSSSPSIEAKSSPRAVVVIDSSSTLSSSEAATEAPTLPGSPISSRTSLSTTGGGGVSSFKDATIVAEASLVEEKGDGGQVVTSTTATTTTIGTTPAPTATTSATPVASTSKTPTPSTAPKSWASLFASSSSSPSSSAAAAATGAGGAGGAAGTSAPHRNALPTSSVVGFSIPASAPTTPPIPVLPAKKSELLSLLTHGLGSISSTPAPSTTTTTTGGGGTGEQQQRQQQKIRTRGLINSGNMCFANAVLQVLVYCAPFQRLFIELGRLMVVPGSAGSGGPKGQERLINGTNTASEVKSQTPFIDATVEFLKEFIVEDREKERERKRGGGYGKGGKGKEKEVAVRHEWEEDGEDEDEWPQSFLPTYVYEAMKEKKRFESMRGGQQEDAEEFLGFYLDTLEEELLYIQNSLAPPPPPSTAASAAAAVKQQQQLVEEKEEPEPPAEEGWLEVGKKNRMIVTRTIKAVESPITRIFGGKFKSTLKAPGQKDSVLVEDWRSLRLDIQRDSIHTIQDALAHITDPQPVQVTNPARPGVIIDASQKVLIEALPPVLVLHVKRFCYDTTVGGVVKVTKPIRFEPELEIGPDMMAVTTGKRPHSIKYRLFGAIYHHGHSASGGHYTLDVLHPSRYPGAKLKEGWVRIDDELVSDVRPEDVFDTWEKDETRNAYLLFYRRIRA